jgi:sarcosine oxidase
MAGIYDIIVVGVGSMGSAACYHLARRDPSLRVLGLEQFDVPHGQGSHHGFSRMIRLAYFEHPDYVALLKRAYENWDALEQESGAKLLHLTGGLYLGQPQSELVTGSIDAARKYDLPHEVLDRDELTRRFPQFQLPGAGDEEVIAFFETKAGFLVPERVVSAQAELAMRHGVEIHGRERVIAWEAGPAGVTVRTDKDEYHAGHVVFCGGAWSDRLVRDLGVELTVTRQTLGWFWPRTPERFALGTFPCWALDMAPKANFRGVYYGFPMLGGDYANPGVKIALHWPDQPTDPDTVKRDPQPGDEDDLRKAVRQYIPDADGPLLSLRVCLYTNSPDGHFIIDRHPRHERVTIACGFSGHGFKFTSVVGEVLADLATRGATQPPIGFLGLNRFAS